MILAIYFYPVTYLSPLGNSPEKRQLRLWASYTAHLLQPMQSNWVNGPLLYFLITSVFIGKKSHDIPFFIGVLDCIYRCCNNW